MRNTSIDALGFLSETRNTYCRSQQASQALRAVRALATCAAGLREKGDLTSPKRIEDWDAAGPNPSGLLLSKSSFTPTPTRQWQDLVEKMVFDGTVRRITIKHMGTDLGSIVTIRLKLSSG